MHLQKCDWSKVVSQVAKYAHLQLTKNKILESPSYHTRELLETNYDLQDFFHQKILEHGASIYNLALARCPSDFAFEETRLRLEKSAWFSLQEIHALVVNLEIWSELRNHLPKRLITDELPELYLKVRRELMLPIREFIYPDGAIQYHLHPLLRPKYKSLLDCDERFKKIFHHVMFHHHAKDKWQGSTTDFINNKYVILIKTDHFDHSLGSIIRRSESGLSLYVELKEFQELSQSRERIQSEIDHILHQLAWQFSQVAHGHVRFIAESNAQLLMIDELKAKSIRAIEGGWKRPLITDRPQLFLEGLRHPLLERPVKNNVMVNQDQSQSRTVIISGPNTGGKTVILKSIVLAHLMAQHGLYLPVDDAIIFPFENIIYLSGDDQDIAQGLSSFASEMETFGKLLSNLNENNLVIIDEILKSTSSEEASAMAWGILHRLQESPNTFTLLSTHHNSLKVFAHESGKFISAHMGFAGEEKRPTYKLHFGRPGSSYALEIAEHMALKFPALWPPLLMAQKQLQGQQVRYEQLLIQLTEEKRLQDARYQETKTALEQEWYKLKSEQESFKLKSQTEFEKLRNDLKHIKIDTLNWHEELKQSQTKINLRKVDEQFKQIGQDLEQREEQLFTAIPSIKGPKIVTVEEEIEVTEAPEETKYIIGRQYFSTTFNQKVSLLDIQNPQTDKAIAHIALGPMKTKIPLSDLQLANSQPGRKKDFTFRLDTSKEIKIQWDCRGMRLEEFEHLIQDLCGHVMAKSMPYAEIIHGHGNGVLKHSIRNQLKNHPDLEAIVDPLKSDGVTVIKLK